MDVRQFDFLAAQPSAALKPRETFCGISKRALALLLVNVVFWQPIWAQADGIVVSSGGGNTRLDQAGNGVPIVNIATPGANGLSHNQFQDYNVDSRGVILNNVTDRTGNTQLGGIIVGNPNLKGAAAGVILNEVVGGSPSQLKGYTEVAGQSARVIVANPYGVTCNGCGFINTPRVTLTTGKPVLDGNRLDHFQVDGGSVSVEGNGLNADNVDQFDIVTRSAKINAELHARQLNVIAGRNDVAADSLAATPRAASPGDAPQLAIDSSALGGMYANTIRLVGTEAGVGVKLAGNLAASAGDIQLDANGQLTVAQTAASDNIALKGQGLDVQGPVYAGGSVTAQSGGDLSVRQSVAAANAIALNAAGQLTNGGIVEAGVNPDNSRNATGDVSLQGAGITNRGSVIASRSLTVTTAGTLDNTGATLSAGNRAQINATTLNNTQGRVQSRGGLTVQAGTLTNAQGIVTSTGALEATLGQTTNGNGEISSQDRLTLRGQSLDNRQGKLIGTSGLDLTLSGNLDNRSGTLVSHGDLQARVTGTLDNRQQGNLYGAGATVLSFDQLLNAQGVLASDAALTLTGNQVNNDGGQLGSQGNLTATLGRFDQLDGQFISQGQLTLIADRLGNTGNGLVAGKTGLELQVGTVDNRGGELSSQSGTANLTGQSLLNGGGKVIAGTVLTAKVATLDNSASGVLSAQQGLQVIGARLANDNGGLLTSGGDVQATLTGALTNAGGQILGEGTMSLAATSLDNRQGIVSSAGQQTLTMTGGVVQNDGGQLVTDSGLSLGSASLDNGTGALSAKGAVTLTTTGAISNAQNGRLISSDTLTVTANSLTNAGRLASTKDLAVTATNLTNGGELFSQAGVTLDLQNGTLTNATGGLITAPGALLLKNLNTVRNAGELSSSLAFTLAAGSLDNSGGKLISNADLTLRIARALTNAKGTLSAAGLDLRAASLANMGGTLASRGALSVTTTGLLDNSADGLLSATTTLDVTADTLSNVGGSLLAKGAATITASQLDNTTKGLINSQASLTVTADRLDSSNGGEVSAKGDVQLTLGEFKQQGGRLIGEAAVGLDLGRAGGTGNLDNTGGLITTTGVFSFAHLNQVNNTGGEIGSSQGFSLIAQGLNNTRGKLISQGLLSIQASQLTNDGGLLSGWQGLTVTGGNLSNRQSGTLSSKVGDLTAALTGTLDNGDNGALVSQGVLKVTAASLTNTGGVLSSGAAQILTVTDTLQNGPQGLIDAGTTLSVSAGQFANTGGTAQAQGAFIASGASLDNSNGILNGQQTVTLDLVGALTNTSGAVLAKGDLLIKNATAVSNAHGRLNSGSLLTLLVGGLDNSSGGTVAAQGNLLLTTGGQVLNGGDGLLASQGGALNVTAGSLDNANGTLQSAGDLTLATGTGDIGNVGGKVIAQNGDLHITGANLDSRGGTLASLQGAFIAGINGLLKNGGQGQTGGTIQAQRLELSAATLDNYNGKVSALGGNALLQTGQVDNRNGSLYGKGLVQVRGGSFDNSGDNDGQVFGNQIDFGLSGALNNRLGIIESSSTLSLAAVSLDNTNGQLRALGTGGTTQITLGGALDNTNGRVETANQDLQLATGGLTNTNGTLLHVGTGTFGLGLPLLQNAGGSVTSNGTLTLSGSSWTNSSTLQVANLAVNVDNLTQTGSGQLLAGNSFTGTGSNWTNDGVIAAGGNLSLTLGGTYQGAGRISSGYDFNLNAGQLLLDSPNGRVAGGVGTTTFNIGGLLRNQARITSAGNANLSAGQVDNQGTLGAAGSLIVNTPTLTNLNGLVFSGGDMGLWVNDFTNKYADVYSLGNLAIARAADGSWANTIVNRSGNLTSDGSLLLASNSIQNIRDVLTVNNAGIYTAEILEKPCDRAYVGDCKGSNRNGLFEVTQRDKLEVTAASAGSSITSGQELTVHGGTLLNSSSTIATGGNLTASVETLSNEGVVAGSTETSRTFVTARHTLGSHQEEAADFTDKYWYESQNYLSDNLSGLQAALAHFISTTESEVSSLQHTTQIASSDASYSAIIQAGGAVNIRANNNIDNSVVRPGYTYVSGGQRTDTKAPGTQFATVVTLNPQLPPDLAQQQISPTTLPGFTLPSGQNGLFRLSGQQGDQALANQGSVAGSVFTTSVGLGPLQNAVNAAGASASTATASTSSNVQRASYTGTTGVLGLPTSVGQNLPHRYLVETNPALTDLKQFLSSDYLLGNLNYNPDDSWRRLGDGLYEQRLIQQAIVARTGQRFLAGMSSDEAQFKYLMDNAIASKQALNLSVGISLTAEQVAALTHDIVWMEDQVVNGQHVLVPVLYLAQANNRLAANGALIQGSDVTLIAGNDLNNAGTLRATNGLTAQAGNNLGNSGLIQAGDRLSLTSTRGNITNRAGGIIAGRDVTLDARLGDILNERTVISHQSAAGENRWRTDFADSAARIEAANDLTLQAGRDVSNVGGVLSSGRDLTINAGRDANLVSAQVETERSSGSNFRASNITQLGGTVGAARDLSVEATRNIQVVASNLSAERDASLYTYEGDITLATAANQSDSVARGKKMATESHQVTQQVTTLNAGRDISIDSGKDLGIIGSTVKAGADVILNAVEDTTIAAAKDESSYSYFKKKKGSFGKSSTTQQESYDSTNVASVIEAGHDLTINASKADDGSISLDGGRNVTVIGSQLRAGNDLLLGATQDVNILSGSEEHGAYSKKAKSGSFGLSKSGKTALETSTTQIGSELKAGQDAVIVAGNDVRVRGSNVSAGRDAELRAGVISGTGDVTLGSTSDSQYTYNEQYKKKFGLSLSDAVGLAIGTPSWGGDLTLNSGKKAGQESTNTSSVGSYISAERDVTLKAARDVNVVGSGVSAGRTATLGAGRDVNVLADANAQGSSQWQTRKTYGLKQTVDSNAYTTFVGNETIKDKTTNYGLTAATSQIDAGLDINISAKRDVLVQGADLYADNDINLRAQRNVRIEAAGERNETTTSHSQSRTGTTTSVNYNFGNTVDAVKGVGQGENTVSQVSGGLKAVDAVGQYLAGPTFDAQAGSNRQGQTATQISQGARGASLSAGNDINVVADNDVSVIGGQFQAGRDINVKGRDVVFDVARGVDTSESQQDQRKSGFKGGTSGGFKVGYGVGVGTANQDSSQGTSSATQLDAGRNINLDASHDLALIGTQARANNDLSLSAGNDLTIRAAGNDSRSDSNRHSGGAEAGITVGRDGLGVYGSVNIGRGQLDREGVQQQEAFLYGGGKVSFTSGRDTTVAGATIRGQDVAGDVGRNLTVSSLPDTGKASGREYDASLTVTVGYGASVSGSVGYGETNGQTNWVNRQTGITAADSLNIRTGNHTQLDGAVLASDNGNLKLDTGSLGFRDIAGEDRERGYYLNVGGTYGLSNGASGSTNAQQDPSQVGKGKTGVNGWSVEGYDYQKDREQIVRATVGAGEITVRQEAETGQDFTAGLNRDKDHSSEITKDESSRTNFYASDSSIKAVSQPTTTAKDWARQLTEYDKTAAQNFKEVGLVIGNQLDAFLHPGAGAEAIKAGGAEVAGQALSALLESGLPRDKAREVLASNEFQKQVLMALQAMGNINIDSLELAKTREGLAQAGVALAPTNGEPGPLVVGYDATKGANALQQVLIKASSINSYLEAHPEQTGAVELLMAVSQGPKGLLNLAVSKALGETRLAEVVKEAKQAAAKEIAEGMHGDDLNPENLYQNRLIGGGGLIFDIVFGAIARVAGGANRGAKVAVNRETTGYSHGGRTDSESATSDLPRIGSLTGEPEKHRKNAPPELIRSINRQNEAARKLADAGYDIERLPNNKRGVANPDIKINGEFADIASPRTGSAGSIRQTISDKVEKQAQIVVINLADSPLKIKELSDVVLKNAVPGLKKLYIMKDGEIKVMEFSR